MLTFNPAEGQTNNEAQNLFVWQRQ